MKAFLLAAGMGTRLRPLTDTVPKCLLPIDGRPMLDIWLDALAAAGIDEVLVNLHHLADRVEAHLAQRRAAPRVHLFPEPVLLGSAGTLAANREFIADEYFFLACYADNLTDFDLGEIIAHHRAHDVPATLALTHTDEPHSKGIVELDAEGIMISFEEKPEHPCGDLANAGIYAFAPSVLDLIEGPPPADIGYNLLPRLIGRARGLVIDAYLRDIGTLESYAAAQRDWAARKSA